MKLSLLSLPVWVLFGLFGFQATKAMSQCDVDVATSLVFSQGEPTEGYGLVLETVAEHTAEDLAGLTTYRLYMQTAHPTDRIIAVVGDDEFPLSLMPETSFYQNPFGGSNPEGISPAWIGFFPDVAYDSWITIGLDGPSSSSAGEEGVTMLFASGWESVFGSGQGFVEDSEYGSGWGAVPWTAINTLAGPEQRILLAQLTTDGHLSGSMRVQVFPESDNKNNLWLDVTFDTNVVCGCTDQSAANHNPDANADDGSCLFEPCSDESACNFGESTPPFQGCDYPEPGYDCEGNCFLDQNNDGVCDPYQPDQCHTSQADVEGCPGDFKLSGYVDINDLLVFNTLWGDVCSEPGCDGDFTGDGEVDVNDLLDFFQLWGNECPWVWVPGDPCNACTDPEACNFSPNATNDDGSCAYPEDEYPCSCLNDVVPPELTIPDDYVAQYNDELVYADAIAIDDCGGVEISLIEEMLEGNCPHQYTLLRTFTATDDAGNSTSSTQTIEVVDTTAPALTIPADYTAECWEELVYEDASATDNCGSIEIALEEQIVEGDCPQEFTILRTFTATDDAGNSTTLTQTITVVDTTPPELFVPPSYEASCEDELILLSGLTTDLCGASVVVEDENYTYSSPNTYLLTRTFTAFDLCGNTTVGIQTIVVQGDYDALGVCGGDCPNDADQDGICDNQDDCVGVFDECGVCNGPGEVFECGCQGVPNGACDCEGNVLDALGICGGNCVEDDDNNGVCDTAEVLGCTYDLADNYDPMATRDDGLCEFPCSGDINQNVFDWDGDSAVTIADFLAMLSVFGDVDVDSDGVWDSSDECTDLAACNYADEPSTPCQFLDVLDVCGGGCEADEDSDGVCDDIDDCIGVVDECGVCNGPGPTEVVIDDITIIYDSVYAENIDTWFVYELGADTTFSITCAPSFSACGDPISYQGYDYATVLIGEQCWFAENLRSENYENGDAIPSDLNGSEWQNTLSGAVAVYGESSSNLENYGRLYNWHAVDHEHGLCPNGWHVPSDGEWMTMEMALGMSEAEANDSGYRGTDQGKQMKTTYDWCCGGGSNGTNSSGFSGLPGGYRLSNGPFTNAGSDGIWWSSSPNGSGAWSRSLTTFGPVSDVVRRDSYGQSYGHSVRCIQD